MRSYFGAAMLMMGVTALPAEASVAYAYSMNSITTFAIVGDVTPQNVTTNGTNYASYLDLGAQGPISSPSDASQAFVGPAFPPAENTFGPLGTSSKDFARADSRTSRALPFDGQNVAEALRTWPGVATADAYDSINLEFSVNANDPYTFFFVASPQMQVETVGQGAVARARIITTLSLISGGDLLLTWRPDGTETGGFEVKAGGVSSVADPYSLNLALTCDYSGCNKGYSRAGTYGFTYAPSTSGTLKVNLLVMELANVVTVPEPASIGVFGMALTGLIWRKRVRRATRIKLARPIRTA